MAKQSLTITVRIDGLQQTLAAFKRLPKDASDELRTAATELAATLAGRVQSAARAQGRQAKLVAPSVKARRDRVPVIVAEGTKRVGRNRVPTFKVLFGSEFGSTRLKQYKPHLGKGSYWFFATVDGEAATIAAAWTQAADNIVAKFGEAP